jgi:hypothetical protein
MKYLVCFLSDNLLEMLLCYCRYHSPSQLSCKENEPGAASEEMVSNEKKTISADADYSVVVSNFTNSGDSLILTLIPY